MKTTRIVLNLRTNQYGTKINEAYLAGKYGYSLIGTFYGEQEEVEEQIKKEFKDTNLFEDYEDREFIFDIVQEG